MAFNWKAAGAAMGQSLNQIGGMLVQSHLIQQRDQKLAEIRQQETAQKQGYMTSEREAKQAFSAEQGQLTRDAQAANNQASIDARTAEAEKDRAHSEKMFEKGVVADRNAQATAFGQDLTMQDDRQAHEAQMKLMEQQAKQAASAGISQKEISEIQKTAWSRAKDIIPAPKAGQEGAADTALSDAASQMSQLALQERMQGKIPDMNVIANEVATRVSENAKYQELFQNPQGDKGLGTFGFGGDIDQSALYIEKNSPPNAPAGYLKELMSSPKVNFSPSRQEEVLNILRPTRKAPDAAINALMQNPSPEMQQQFLEKYGALPAGIGTTGKSGSW